VKRQVLEVDATSGRSEFAVVELEETKKAIGF